MLPLSLVDESPLLNINDSPTLLSSSSTLGIATYFENVLLLMSNEILTPSPMSDLPLQRINNTDPPVFLPEPEATLNTNQLSPVDNPADIVSSFPLLSNDSPPTIITIFLLLNDDAHYVIFNNPPSSPNDIPELIVTYTPSFTVSRELTLTITNPSASI